MKLSSLLVSCVVALAAVGCTEEAVNTSGSGGSSSGGSSSGGSGGSNTAGSSNTAGTSDTGGSGGTDAAGSGGAAGDESGGSGQAGSDAAGAGGSDAAGTGGTDAAGSGGSDAGGEAGSAGAESGGSGGGSATNFCSGQDKWACDPLSTTATCKGAGSACDLDLGSGQFMCYDPPNDVPVGGSCDNGNGPFCAQGSTCTGGKCARYCCTDADCNGQGTCTALGGAGLNSVIGVCVQ